MADHRQIKYPVVEQVPIVQHQQSHPTVTPQTMSQPPMQNQGASVPPTQMQGGTHMPSKDIKRKKKKKEEEVIDIDLDKIKDEGVREIFKDLLQKIENKQRDIQGLSTLKMLFLTEGKESFDKSDMEVLDSYMQKEEAKLLAYEQKLRLRVKLYDKTILRLYNILRVRKEILNKADAESAVLERNPKLLDEFVEKQRQLEEILEETKTKLKIGIDSDDEDGGKGRRHWADDDSEIE